MYKEAWDKIVNARYVVIVSHVHPDGDAIGSTLALYNTLKELGKKVALFNATQDELPREFGFLEGFSKIQSRLPKFFDLLVCCDCASFDRVGVEKGDYEIVNIDHHKSNKNFGDINVVLPEASSAGIVVYRLLKANDIKISKRVAIALYTAIADDTGFFRYGEIDATTFEVASRLIECGVNPKEVASEVKSSVSLAKTRLTAYMLTNFELHKDATIASVIIDRTTLEATGAKRSDTKSIINMLRDISNVKVALMVLELDRYCKVSLRSDGEMDVSKISTSYGGGGHRGAAGFDVKSSDIIATCKEILNLLKR
jgi:phosphoesterase RecJ-like protein